MATRDTIVIGASAGGVPALTKLVSDLDPDLPAAVFIVLHTPSNVPSLLPEILSRDARLRLAHAVDGEESNVIRELLLAAEKGDIGEPVTQTGDD